MRTFLAASIVAVVLSVPSVADAKRTDDGWIYWVKCDRMTIVRPDASWAVSRYPIPPYGRVARGQQIEKY